MMTVNDIIHAVAQAMREAGIDLVDLPIADGKLHRLKIAGDTGGEKTAWCNIHTDAPIRAVFGCNNRGPDWKRVWQPAGEPKLTLAQQKELHEQLAKAKRKAADDKRLRQAKAAIEAAQTWDMLNLPKGDHPYLVAKRIGIHGIRAKGNALVIPLRDADGELHSLQFIDPAGDKRLLTGGRKEGCFHTLLQPGEKLTGPLALCEGYSTAASVHEATGLHVIAAVDAGNLLPVAKALRKAYPDLELIIGADNDCHSEHNTGIQKARDVCRQVKGVRMVYPEFEKDELASKPTDFNDLACLRGPQAVQAVFDAILNPPMSPLAPVRSATKSKPAERLRMTMAGGEICLLDDGVYFIGQGSDGDPLPPMRICSPLRIHAQTRNQHGEDWGRLLEWRDPDGVRHDWALPMSMLAGDGADVRSELLSGGLSIAPGRKPREWLSTYLQTWPVEARALCVSQTGWAGRCFVTPHESIGCDDAEETVVYQSAKGEAAVFIPRGDLDGWIEHIAKPAEGNTRLMLAICAGLAPALLEFTGLEGGGVHLVGPSSVGKSIALEMARSVWGSKQFGHKWSGTKVGLEAVAIARSGLLLTLDELGQVDPRDAADIGYTLANGAEKLRGDRNGNAKQRRTWKLIFLSSGEITLADRAAEAGGRLQAGAEVRVLNIPAKVGPYGIFNRLPAGCETGEQAAKQLERATSEFYGTAGPAFVRKLVEDFDTLSRRLRSHEDAFLQFVPHKSDGQVYRGAKRFALMAAAGELASKYGILPWKPGAATEALRVCFNDWMDMRGGQGSAEEREALAQVRRILEAGREARFSDFGRAEDDRKPVTQDMYGFRRRDESTGHKLLFLVTPERFKADVCKGLNYKSVLAVLQSHKLLVKNNSDRPTLSVRMPGSGLIERFIAIKGEILGADDNLDRLLAAASRAYKYMPAEAARLRATAEADPEGLIRSLTADPAIMAELAAEATP